MFWSATGLVGFVYAGYPLLLLFLRLVIRRPIHKRPIEPTISLLVTAYNEAEVIEAKLRNALTLDYPPDRLEIVVASDGSTDRTAEIVSALAASGRPRLFAYPRHRGKVAAMNDTIPHLRGEVVVFSDAASRLRPDALRRLVASLADPTVGAVSGTYRVARPDRAELGEQDDLYWRYETFLKRQEGALGSALGAHGGLYAIRRALYPFPALETINDDFVIPLDILRLGYRIAYEPQAVVYEDAGQMEGFSRRVRVMAGNVEQLRAASALLCPLRPLELFCFLVHKGGRLVVAPTLLVLLCSNVFLVHRRPYRLLLGLQGLFYALALLGSRRRLEPRVLRLPYYFCMVHAAVFPGLYYALRGRRGLVWKGR